ncbi:ladinin-1 isoform X2 [Mixophyes fleayi]
MSSVQSTEDRDILTNRRQTDRQQEYQRSKVQEKEDCVSTKQKENNKQTRNNSEENKVYSIERLEDQGPVSIREETQVLKSKKEETQKDVISGNGIQEQESRTEDKQESNSEQRENNLSKNENEKCPESEGSKKCQMHENVRKPNQESSSWKQENHVLKIQTQSQEISSQNNKDLRDEYLQGSDSKVQNILGHKNNSISLSVSVNTKSSDKENVTSSSSVTSPSHGNNHVKYKSQVFVSSVKIPRLQSDSDRGVKSPLPLLEETEEAHHASRTVRTKVVIPSLSSTVCNTTQSSKQENLPTPLQTSTSFKRLTPLTSSVRTLSQSEDRVDSGLIRSSSLRLSLRSKKIDDRMEKYTSAIKKSASVRIPSSHSRGVIGASDGVASKRSIFEKEENSGRSNICRKDIMAGDVASKRNLWQQRSQSSSDTKL